MVRIALPLSQEELAGDRLLAGVGRPRAADDALAEVRRDAPARDLGALTAQGR